MEHSNLAETIRLLRKSKGLTQSELGNVLGYSARTVSDWENGATEPNISAIRALVAYFEISFDEFFGY